MHVEFSPEALDDLDEIHNFIARDKPLVATRWIEKLIERAEKIGRQPFAGRKVSEVNDSLVREVLLKNYRIVYRIEPNRLLIVTVIEGHRRLRL